jgi:hypothetical protein
MQKVDSGWGVFFKYKMLTDTRDFSLVEKALNDSGIKAYHPGDAMLERPKPATAFTRSMGYLTRVCTASIPFPSSSPNSKWIEDGKEVSGERNPNYSLKIESVKGMPDGEIAYRINISDRRNKDENMAHVLTATYRPDLPVEIQPGEASAWNKFGEDIHKLVDDAYTKFFNNYDDTDLRDVVVKELASLSAVNVLGKTTNFIAKDTEARPNNTARATALAKFVHDCGHLANILGLDSSPMTRDAIVDELRSSIMSDLEDYERELDDKLNAKTKERQRGEKQRARMKTTAEQNIDKIMALAEYHQQVLGVIADGIKEKAATLRAKATEFLTRDFGSGAPTQTNAAGGIPVSDLEKRIAALEAENARLRSFQGVAVAAPHAAQPAPEEAKPIEAQAEQPAPVVVPAGEDPFKTDDQQPA